MARTKTEIKKIMTDDYIANPAVVELYELDSFKSFEQQFSRSSLESIMFYVVASAHNEVENLFDELLLEVTDAIRNQRPHTINWYRVTALAFRFGSELRADLAEYDNRDLSDEEIEAQRIIKKCSVTKADMPKPVLIMKVNRQNGKLNENEKEAFSAYMDAKADAGVTLSIISEDADALTLHITVRYDAQVIDRDGNRLSDGVNVVKETIKAHLDNLEFNGVFYPSMLEQELMRQPGVKVATVTYSEATIAGGYPSAFIDKYEPYSGAIIAPEQNLYMTYERF